MIIINKSNYEPIRNDQSHLNPPRKKSAKSARNSKAADSSTVENEQKALFIRKYKGYVFHIIFKMIFKKEISAYCCRTKNYLKLKPAD